MVWRLNNRKFGTPVFGPLAMIPCGHPVASGTVPTPRWMPAQYAASMLPLSRSAEDQKRAKNFNSGTLNALPLKGDSGGLEIENLELTEPAQHLI